MSKALKNKTKLNDMVSVKDFGAVGDGVADDTAAIQAAGAASDDIWFPSGTYLVSSTIQFQKAIRIDGDHDVTIRAKSGFAGINVTKDAAPYTLKAIFAIFAGSTINTISGTRIGETGLSPSIGAISLDCATYADYGVYAERTPGIKIAASVYSANDGIYLGPYCWGAELHHNKLMKIVNYGVYLGIGANGASVINPEIWGQTLTTNIGVYSYGNNNAVLIEGGYIETCTTGVYIESESGSHTIKSVDFEIIAQHCVRTNKPGAEARLLGPITVENCYLDSTLEAIYNDKSRFIVKNNRFRNPGASGSYYKSTTVNAVFEMSGNSYDDSGGAVVPENVDQAYGVTSARQDVEKYEVVNKKYTNTSGSYFDHYVIKNYAAQEQPKILSNSMAFQNSRQGGVDLLYSGRWVLTVNETWSSGGTPAIVYTSGVQLVSLGGTQHFSPVSDNSIRLGNSSTRWSTVYAGTGTINTSDAREKQDIEALDDAEMRVAVKLKGLIKKFHFKDAVQAKGEAARIHVGLIAQEVKAAFESEGLPAERYAILCYDEWDDQFEDVRDENGNSTGEKKLIVPAGNRYGIRYEQLLAFIIAAL